jgi:hypothetical protein
LGTCRNLVVDTKAFMGPPKPLSHQKNGHSTIQAEGAPGSVRAGCTVRAGHNHKLQPAAVAPWFLKSLKVRQQPLQAVAAAAESAPGTSMLRRALAHSRHRWWPEQRMPWYKRPAPHAPHHTP